MDVKILAAVFVSLAAVFAGADGGMFSTSDIKQVQQKAGIAPPTVSSLTSDIPYVSEFLEKPKPTNEIKAKIVLKDDSNLMVKKARLEAQDLTKINAKSMMIDSDKDILFRQFTGQLDFTNTTQIKGTASGMKTSGVNITTGIGLNTKVDTNRIEIQDTGRIGMKFSRASIGPTANSDFSLDTENKNLNINSYTGDITVYPKNKTMIIDGKIDSLNAGKYSLEG